MIPKTNEKSDEMPVHNGVNIIIVDNPHTSIATKLIRNICLAFRFLEHHK